MADADPIDKNPRDICPYCKKEVLLRVFLPHLLQNHYDFFKKNEEQIRFGLRKKTIEPVMLKVKETGDDAYLFVPTTLKMYKNWKNAQKAIQPCKDIEEYRKGFQTLISWSEKAPKPTMTQSPDETLAWYRLVNRLHSDAEDNMKEKNNMEERYKLVMKMIKDKGWMSEYEYEEFYEDMNAVEAPEEEEEEYYSLKTSYQQDVKRIKGFSYTLLKDCIKQKYSDQIKKTPAVSASTPSNRPESNS